MSITNYLIFTQNFSYTENVLFQKKFYMKIMPPPNQPLLINILICKKCERYTLW